MMESKISGKPFSRIVIVFLIINLLLFGLINQLVGWNIDIQVAVIGNLVLFLATFLSFRLYSKGLKAPGTHAFLRMTYSGMLLKMGICIVAAVVYGILSRGKINKGGLFICFGCYFLYSFLEVKILTRLTREKKDA